MVPLVCLVSGHAVTPMEDHDVDLGCSHVALAVSDLDVSLGFFQRFADMEVVHRRVGESGNGVAWVSDLSRPFAIVLLEGAVTHPMGGWAHLGVGCASSGEVDQRLADAAAAGFEVIGPFNDGPPTGYWGIIVGPDGHNLELAHGQQVGLAVRNALA